MLVLLVSCSSKVKEETYNKKGLIYYSLTHKPYTGKMKGFINGQKIQYFVKDGMKHGLFRLYYKNGKIQMEGQIEKNLNAGKWCYYYESGSRESEGYFKDDLTDSLWCWYYPGGSLREKGYFKKGKREGDWFSYDQAGSVLQMKVFLNDEVIKSSGS